MNKSRFLIAPLAGLLLTSGCHRDPDLVTNAAGHPVEIRVVGAHRVESGKEQGIISGPAGKITLEPERFRINDLAWTSIREEVPVRVDMRPNLLWVRAGKVTVTMGTR